MIFFHLPKFPYSICPHRMNFPLVTAIVSIGSISQFIRLITRMAVFVNVRAAKNAPKAQLQTQHNSKGIKPFSSAMKKGSN